MEKSNDSFTPLPHITKNLSSLQEEIFKQKGIRTDVYFMEGKGALFVRENSPLSSPYNVVVHIPSHLFVEGSTVTVNLR